MVKVEPIKNIAFIVRFYDDLAFSTSDRPPFIASCLLEQDINPKIVWIKNMSGSFGRKQLKDITVLIRDLGFEKAKAVRADGHILPFGKTNEYGEWEMITTEAVKRLKL